MRDHLAIVLLAFISILLPASVFAQNEKPFLSHLQATKDDPLYTTYAAAMERSEFTLDEGYHLLYYDSTRGADLTTDKAGDWCLAFKQGAHFVYALKDMFRAPVITVSYPDMVAYRYYPFKNLKVEITFFVYSSRSALQDIRISNVSGEPVSFTIYSFLKNNYRVFDNVRFLPKNNAITFTHEELPDAWTLQHHIPYLDTLYDAFLTSMTPDAMKSFRQYQWGNVSVPRQVYLKKKQKYLVHGSLKFDRTKPVSQAPRVFAYLKDNTDTVLTESAPRWGSTDPNSTPWYYGIELGNFKNLKQGTPFTIRLFSRKGAEAAVVMGKVGNLRRQHELHKDALFKAMSLPPPPANFHKDVWGNGTEIRLYWTKNPAMSYNVYRRDYRKEGFYVCVAKNIKHAFYTDKNIQGDKIYGYFVTAVDSSGRMSRPTRELTNIFGSDFLTDMKYPDQIKTDVTDFVRVLSLQKQVTLAAGQSFRFRAVRAFAKDEREQTKILKHADSLLNINLKHYLQKDEALLSKAPDLPVTDKDRQMLYWSAFNMMRQVFLPPEGKCHFNYYVFSREPTWGWGHGGQVFHESLSMMAYALLDPQSAMDSQRIFKERQHADGYINYRTGPYLDEIIKYNGELTSSAPWYAWENWQVYSISKDTTFLREMYSSSEKLYRYFVIHRDKDGDGLCEWGGHAVLESVRDGDVAVWDQVGWPSEFEALDLNCMLVMEAKSLAKMAGVLGKKQEADYWQKEAEQRSAKINQTFWDEETGFYYHVDKRDNDFTFKTKNDLKRQEIIGFLPLWAGIASKAQAGRLVKALTDTSKFWRKYGVPSLAADDPYYNPQGYWNGPVWVEWNYLIVVGLLKYGYKDLARALVNKVADNMIAVLKKNHNLWEFYSPDAHWAGYHRTYIWAGIINRMLLDVNR